ncbi:DUF1285 domain-containing protein [Shewanella surugensis]|uniref:DUF1285 domain-containing protein n=1 Tax=Shewanella surugensis TaxID=212020 RepID=A0ABT0LJ11_9GAMM|nr:DUF1285 domain-containing protein [Shewanella surugensis]MCL1127697.1 DUF1285 domain-containing protein [Shewanella surugensis]
MSQEAQKTINALMKQAPLCNDEALFNIDEQGEWFYLKSPLPQKFSRLFSTILYCIENEHFLITPVEKLKVSVAEVPLIIVDYTCHSECAKSETRQERDYCSAFTVKTSLETAYEVRALSHFVCGEEAITVMLDRGLIAKLGRACYYRFINDFI